VITLVVGGARSGKSAVAERLACRGGGPVTCLVTGVATDEDMAGRIAAHRARRPASFATIECGADLFGALERAKGTVIIDALGTWLAGLEGFAADAERLCTVLRAREATTIVVSEEVGLGVHPSSEQGRRFRDALGEINQAVARIADVVLFVVAGRTLALASLDGDA
jgi:adenosylcobinamide kinase/adenosylcobinamide-phosphate guanylyltransferase